MWSKGEFLDFTPKGKPQVVGNGDFWGVMLEL